MAIAKHKTRRRELREGRALARGVQRGDRRAFELLYASYEGRLYRVCHRLTGSDAAAASLVEATFVRALSRLPEGGLDGLDVPAHLTSTARALAYERHTNGGAPWLDPIPGEHAGEVGIANQRLAPRQRIVLVLRDLEHRPDDEIALALGADPGSIAALVARARLRLRAELQLPGAGAACHDRLAELSAYVDDTLPAERRAPLETHVAECPGCRAALFALQEAALRYRELPVPVPPGELRSRITVALGAVGFPTRRPRALAADPSPASAGRPLLAAAAMAALVVLGAGVTVAASHDVWGASAPKPPPTAPVLATLPPPPEPISQVPAAAVPASIQTPLPAPPATHHERGGPSRVVPRPATHRRLPPPYAGTPDFVTASPPAAPPPPASPPAPPPTKPKPTRPIPVQILPPSTPARTPVTADAPPPPPEPETTTTP